MRARHRWGLAIDLLLWAAPLAGVAMLLGAVLASHPPPLTDSFAVRQNAVVPRQTFDLPGRGALVLALLLMVVPLGVALFTRRGLGFLAGTSLVLGLVAGAAWIRSQTAWDILSVYWQNEQPQQPTFHHWMLTLSGGGVGVQHEHWAGQAGDEYARSEYVPPGRQSSLVHQSGKADGSYLANFTFFYDSPRWLRHLGFAFVNKPPTAANPYAWFGWAVHWWFVCVLAAPLPLAWMFRLRTRRRRAGRAASGLCVTCGYDLRATPEAGGKTLARCPECGAMARHEAEPGQPAPRGAGEERRSSPGGMD